MLLRAEFKPRSPLKSMPQSFTIFGAICWGVAVLYGDQELKNMLENFKHKPPFLISSPLMKSEHGLLFPKPILKDGWGKIESREAYKERKDSKKVSKIDEECFRKIVRGEIQTDKQLWECIKNKEVNLHLTTVNIPHASINRITWTTEGGQLYNEEATYVGSPFSVFIYLFDKSYREKIEASLKFTQLGGNKTTGMGYCEVEFEEDTSWIKDHVEKQSDRFITLAPMFYDESIAYEESYFESFPVLSAVDNFYRFLSRNVWKRKRLYLTSGSFLKVKEGKDFYGGVRESLKTEDISILQYGLAFPIYVGAEG